ncbi:MAG: hypothetical protein WBP82_08695 [Leuconostoc mesenteroides]
MFIELLGAFFTKLKLTMAEQKSKNPTSAVIAATVTMVGMKDL